MKVVLTETAENCLWAIWDHDRLYSEQIADRFQRDIDRFIRDAIAANPEIGTPPKREPIGEWHFNKEGVPVAGPAPSGPASNQGERAAVSPSPPGKPPRGASGDW